MRANAARRREAEAAEAGRRELEARLAALAQSNAELGGRLGSMSEWLGSRQADLARVMSERSTMSAPGSAPASKVHAQTTGANLNKLNERLAVIDAAQARMVGMTEEVVSLKDILSNKQTRGAFGQGRMEAIVSDGLPVGAYEFPGDAVQQGAARLRHPPARRLARAGVDAKFPLEAFTLFNEARDDDSRKAATARVRADVGKHVKDIAERYLLRRDAGHRADVRAVGIDLFRPGRAFRRRGGSAPIAPAVVILSPSLMMMAIQVTQAILRDQRMRDQAHAIHAEVGKLLTTCACSPTARR